MVLKKTISTVEMLIQNILDKNCTSLKEGGDKQQGGGRNGLKK